MIKEILQDNINKSLSKEKKSHKKSKSFLDGFDIFKKLNTLKKSKNDCTFKKNNNLKLPFNRNENENIYTKKLTNLKTCYLLNNNKILYRNNNFSLDTRINFTMRENFRKNKIIKEEEKVEKSFEKNKYVTERLKSNGNNLIKNLDEEFEIRCLNKKLQELRVKNKEIDSKLKNIKEKNNSLKYEIQKEQNNRNNILYSLKNIYYIFFKNEMYPKEKHFELKDFLLDLMDLNYNYENAFLINTFFQNFHQLMLINNIFNSDEDIHSNIKNLIKNRDQAIKYINNIKEYKKDNEKYKEFCYSLFQIFETKDLDSIYNNLIEINSNNENDIRKIIKMRNILFSQNTSSSKRLITNISVDKLKKNKKQYINLNYSDLKKIDIENNQRNNNKTSNFNLMTEKRTECLTDRINLFSNKNKLINLKNQNNQIKTKFSKNNNIDMDKINQFLCSTKVNNCSFNYLKKNIPYSYKYKNKDEEKEECYKSKKLGINLNTSSTNATRINNTQNYIYTKNNENETVLNTNERKIINYNENINKNKTHSRIPSLKKKKYYKPFILNN